MFYLKKQLKRYKRALKHFGIKHIFLNYVKRFLSPVYLNQDVLIGHIYKNADFKQYKMPEDIQFRKLQPNELDRLLKFSPFINKKEALKRFKNNHICYIAEINHKIIFNTWAGDGDIFIPMINKTVSFPKNEIVYFYNTYSDPEYASRKLLPLFLTYMHSIYDEDQSSYTEARVFLDLGIKIPLKAYKRITGVSEFTLLKYKKIFFKNTYKYEKINII